MDETVKNTPSEVLILDAIDLIEKKKKKRTDFDRICNIVVSESTGLSKDDVFAILSSLHKQGILKIKQHDGGPVSYEINEGSEILNTHNRNTMRMENDIDMELEYVNTTCKEDGAKIHKPEKCREDESVECSIDSAQTLQDFLDGIRTPDKVSPKFKKEFEIPDKVNKTNACHGLKEDAVRAKFTVFQPNSQYESPMEIGKVMEIIGKMVETVNNHIEMLRDEKILNRMLTNTIEFQKDDISSKAIKIKELETILERISKPTQDHSTRDHITQQRPKENTQGTCNDQPACRSLEESQQSKKLPSFNSQLEDYVKRKREKYAEYLVKCKAEAMISLKGSQERTSQETNQKRNKGVKQNRTSLAIENRQRKESSALQNENVLNNQHLLRKKLQDQQAKQQQKERHCQNNSENLQLLKHKNGSASSETGKTQETGLWKPGTILIVGDSMLNGVEERKMPSYVKVRNFPGSTVRDMYDCVKALLRKRPSHIILHLGTNDAVNSDCSTIVNQLINIQEHIESELPDSMVTLSLPIMRADNTKADKILAAVRNALKKTSIDTLNNDNIKRDHLGRVGLHLKFHGNAKFAANILKDK